MEKMALRSWLFLFLSPLFDFWHERTASFLLLIGINYVYWGFGVFGFASLAHTMGFYLFLTLPGVGNAL
jgi:hypothetical protein